MYHSPRWNAKDIDSTLINPSRTDIPCFGTLINWLAQRDGYSGNVPPYVITPSPHCDSTKYLTPGQFGGCLGSRFDPFVLNSDPNAKGFQVPGLQLDATITQQRLLDRRSLLSSLDEASDFVTSDMTADILCQSA